MFFLGNMILWFSKCCCSNSLIDDCGYCNAGTSYREYDITINYLYSSYGTCPDCADFSGETFRVTYDESTTDYCRWVYEFPESSTCDAVRLEMYEGTIAVPSPGTRAMIVDMISDDGAGETRIAMFAKNAQGDFDCDNFTAALYATGICNGNHPSGSSRPITIATVVGVT